VLYANVKLPRDSNGYREGRDSVLFPPQFNDEESAEKAVASLNNRWYNGLPIHAELSPVTDFREACCRQYEMGYATHTPSTVV
jgi:hypothetical protein